jgi:hypothetical protein
LRASTSEGALFVAFARGVFAPDTSRESPHRGVDGGLDRASFPLDRRVDLDAKERLVCRGFAQLHDQRADGILGERAFDGVDLRLTAVFVREA